MWLRKALDLAVDSGVPNNKLDAQVCTGYVCVCVDRWICLPLTTCSELHDCIHTPRCTSHA